uniref:hypothetical protein n=1 Tax=Flavobacterium sp. TaxID=239 RepID=UPI004049260A
MKNFKNLNLKEGCLNDYYKQPQTIVEGETLSGRLSLDYGRSLSLYPDTLLSKKYRNHFITIPQSSQNLTQLFNNLKSVSKNLKYLLISQEQHKDDGIHFHINLTASNHIVIKQIHKIILKTEGNIAGSINYQSTKDHTATVTYIKKDNNYLEFGIPPKNGRPKNLKTPQEQLNNDLNEVYKDDKGSLEEKMRIIKEKQPAFYTIHHDKIKNVIETPLIKHRFTYEIKTQENTILKPWQ